MLRSAFALPLLLALSSCDACNPPPLVTPTGTIDGIVCNPVTGQPVGGAELLVTYVNEAGIESTSSDTSDANGAFTMSLPEGVHTVYVTTPAFNDDFEVTVVPLERTLLDEGLTGCRDLAPLPGEGCLVGQICNIHTGEIVRDALITVETSGGQETTNTDPATGNYEICVEQGGFLLSYNGDGLTGNFSGNLEEGAIQVVGPQVAECNPPDSSVAGCVQGIVCEPGNDVPLADADVYVTYQNPDDGAFVTITGSTNDDGEFFVCGIGPTPVINVTVRVESDRGFSYTWPDEDGEAVQVFSEDTRIDGTELTGPDDCQQVNVENPDDAKKFLVVTGSFDRIQDAMHRNNIHYITLANGCADSGDGAPVCSPGDQWTTNVFGDYELLASYDAVFINCGVNEGDWANGPIPLYAIENLRRYVSEAGGNLYVSDWAYEVIEQVWPDKIDFFNDDTVDDSAKQGAEQVVSARAVDPALRTWLTDDSIDPENVTIDFGFANGVIVQSVAADVTVYLEGDRQWGPADAPELVVDAPITVGFQEGTGKVFYTSFHQEAEEEVNGPEDSVLNYVVVQLGD
jgi:hypothetical protein